MVLFERLEKICSGDCVALRATQSPVELLFMRCGRDAAHLISGRFAG